jgi:hypothetical protein
MRRGIVATAFATLPRSTTRVASATGKSFILPRTASFLAARSRQIVAAPTRLNGSTLAVTPESTSATTAATNERLRKAFDVTHPAYEVIDKDIVTEYGAYCTLYRHKKSGAELLSVAVDDDNKVFGVTLRTPPEDSTGVSFLFAVPKSRRMRLLDVKLSKCSVLSLLFLTSCCYLFAISSSSGTSYSRTLRFVRQSQIQNERPIRSLAQRIAADILECLYLSRSHLLRGGIAKRKGLLQSRECVCRCRVPSSCRA